MLFMFLFPPAVWSRVLGAAVRRLSHRACPHQDVRKTPRQPQQLHDCRGTPSTAGMFYTSFGRIVGHEAEEHKVIRFFTNAL